MADFLRTPNVGPFPDGSRPKLLDQVRHTIRTRHYSRRTETTYVHWILRSSPFITRNIRRDAHNGDRHITQSAFSPAALAGYSCRATPR
jgi:hypothetical protein